MSGTGNNTFTAQGVTLSNTGSMLDLTGVSGLGSTNKVIFGSTAGFGLYTGSLYAGSLAVRVAGGDNFLQYDSSNGFVPYTGYSASALNSLVPTDTGSLTANGTLTAARTINALRLADTVLSGSGATLTLAGADCWPRAAARSMCAV